MNKIILLALSVLLIASCSAPKYSYHFDRYDYNSGKKDQLATNSNDDPEDVEEVEPLITPPQFTADVSSGPVVVEKERRRAATEVTSAEKAEAPIRYSDMSKSEKRAFRKELKADVKEYVKSMKKGDFDAPEHVKVMDNDLRLAIIFGAVGLTLSLFGGINEAFWVLGVISIVVGVVFLIKWLVRQ